MQNSSGYFGLEFLSKRKDCVRQLLNEGGFLYKKICSISASERDGFVEDFLNRDEVRAAIYTFIKEIESQIDIVLNPQHLTNANNMTTKDNMNAPAQLIVKTPSGSMVVDNEAIKKVDFPILNEPPVETSLAPSTPNPSLMLEEQIPQTQQILATQSPSVTQPESQQQLKPGEIPATPAPSAKQAPFSEALKTSFSLSANGKTNEEYRGKIQGVNKSGKNIFIKQVDIPTNLGLSFDAGTCELCGIPLEAGEYVLKVHFQFDPPSASDPTPVGTCQLIVNPDPKTLWKNLDSDKSDKYWKPDTDTIFVPGSDGLSMIVASKRGRSHAHAGTFRDDDFKVEHDVVSGWRIMTVADGAGSAKKSRRGSQIATRVANVSIFKALSGERGKKLEDALAAMEAEPAKTQRPVMEELYYLFGNAAKEAVHAISTEANTEGAAYKEFSTTLIITIHKKFSFGHFIGAYWVGDGGSGIYHKGQELNVLGKADSGEFAGQTRFLDTSMLEPNEIMNRIRFKVVKDFTAVLAMTDGITDPKFETDANIENSQKWDELWSELAPTTESARPDIALLEWLDFWSAGNHDDRTIAILCSIKSETATQLQIKRLTNE